MFWVGELQNPSLRDAGHTTSNSITEMLTGMRSWHSCSRICHLVEIQTDDQSQAQRVPWLTSKAHNHNGSRPSRGMWFVLYGHTTTMSIVLFCGPLLVALMSRSTNTTLTSHRWHNWWRYDVVPAGVWLPVTWVQITGSWQFNLTPFNQVRPSRSLNRLWVMALICDLYLSEMSWILYDELLGFLLRLRLTSLKWCKFNYLETAQIEFPYLVMPIACLLCATDMHCLDMMTIVRKQQCP